jgi:hypothetical protein
MMMFRVEKHPYIDKQSQIAERKTLGEQGPETAARKPQNKKSQAHTTYGTRARGGWEPGQKPRRRTGPVLEISGVVKRHRAQPSASQ